MVVAGSCCTWHSQSSLVALFQLCGNFRDLWYALIYMFLHDDRWLGHVCWYIPPLWRVKMSVWYFYVMPVKCVLSRSGAPACLTFPLCSV
jgi:hypothetical protein